MTDAGGRALHRRRRRSGGYRPYKSAVSIRHEQGKMRHALGKIGGFTRKALCTPFNLAAAVGCAVVKAIPTPLKAAFWGASFGGTLAQIPAWAGVTALPLLGAAGLVALPLVGTAIGAVAAVVYVKTGPKGLDGYRG